MKRKNTIIWGAAVLALIAGLMLWPEPKLTGMSST